jgi:putative ABC transport system substrate-binding protein
LARFAMRGIKRMRGLVMVQRPVTRIVFLSFSAVVLSMLLLVSVPGCEKSEKKTYTIGYVNPNPGEREGAQGFLSSMPKFGYVDGKNVMYIRCETRDKKCIENALRGMAAKKVDLIFTVTTPATKMADRLTRGTGIPVVFVMYDAVRSGVVKSLINHGGNVTGIELVGSSAKALEWLRAIKPGTRHIWVPVCFDAGDAQLSLADLQQGAAELGLKTTIAEVATVGELRAALSSMPKDIDAIFMIHSWLVGCNLKAVLHQAEMRKIPVVSAGHVHFDDGLLLSYGPLNDRTGHQAARLADQILRGVRAADIPVETSDFYLGINLKTARSIGLEIPDDILQQADFIIRQ